MDEGVAIDQSQLRPYWLDVLGESQSLFYNNEKVPERADVVIIGAA